MNIQLPTSIVRKIRVNEPFHWSTVGPQNWAGYHNGIDLLRVYLNEKTGWTVSMMSQRHCPLSNESEAKALAVQLIRAWLRDADCAIEWRHEWRDASETIGDWHGFIRNLEIAHIYHCEGANPDQPEWRAWFGPGIVASCENKRPRPEQVTSVDAVKAMIELLWPVWLREARAVADWPNPFFELPPTWVCGELHRERYAGGQMLMQGDGI